MYYEKFDKLCKDWKITPAEVSRRTGIASSTLTNWKKGNYTPKMDKLQLIADFFGVPLTYITSDQNLGQSPEYYVDQQTAELARMLLSDSNYRILFDAAKDSRPEDIQKAINMEAMHLKPHTVSNIYGLLTATLATYRPDFHVKVTLPKKARPDLVVPDDATIIRLLSAVDGTNLELPVLLAAFGPMRRGEICALHMEDISGNIVHVCRNLVKSGDPSAPWIEKAPKSYAGDRYIVFPDFVRDAWERSGITSGRLISICPDTITKKFAITLRQSHIKPFRFHDLRHYSASIQHALGVPDAVIQDRGGWGSDKTLKAIYRHAMEDSIRSQNAIINNHFADIYSRKPDTNPDTQKKSL